MKFRNTTFVLFLSAVLTVSKVQGNMMKTHNLPDIFGNRNGLLARTVNSQKPTSPRPTEPTASPTESPAPSPSPSSVPTKDPARDTTAPTESPTESPAPSPSPSSVPTPAPTATPSSSPSSQPTKSAEPSAVPTNQPSSSPTDQPSKSPSESPSESSEPSANPTLSAQPSDGPSMEPSMAPSFAPSNSPTDRPSESPSDAPSITPTAITDRTKTAVASLLLEEIPTTMDRMALAEFELFTMDFLKKKLITTSEYTLNTLAVTVLSQKTVYPEQESNNKTLFRKLESENWSIGLELSVRAVSVVTEGRVPKNFNFTEEVLYSFYNHWDQYLWQLGNSVEFFSPLVEVSDWVPQEIEAKINEKKKNKATFVIAVMFSMVAFGLALFASYIAINKHMEKTGKTPSKKKRSRGLIFSPKNSPDSYSGADVLNYLTHTMSDENGSPINNYHDGDVEGGGAHALIHNVNIDIDENGMESVVLTPRANLKSPHAIDRNGLYVVNEGSDDDRSPLRSPDAVSPMADELHTRSNPKRIGGQIKKWLTPKAMKHGFSSDANRRMSHDPPENQSTRGYNYGKDHMEPDAMKASTKNNTGVYTTDKSTIDGRGMATGISYNKKSSDEGQFTLPISFFSNRGPNANESGVESPMSSLADSNASSFFALNNMNKSFVGRTGIAGVPEEEGYEVSATKTKMNDPTPTNVASIIRNDHATSNVSKPDKQSIETNENAPAGIVQSLSPSESSAKDSAVRLAAKRFEIQQKQRQQEPLREVQPPNSSIGVETILGARSRDSTDDEDKHSSSSSSFLKSRSIFSPGTKKEKTGPTLKSRKQQPSYGYGKVSVEVQEQETRSVTSNSTLGARPRENKVERDDKSTISALSTLSSVMRRPGCYDVYAPSGPIGIVVDTSKDGPSVHSLKSTSPMLGLITAGDLIIALDGEDTRKMTAAALTRLMARKSRQKERKITLLS
eukprot:CAMPEP_0197176152 /NCGR_PEP_ID=MMETSP1423-20130617/2172_1 /TAXON_ID=476441 /ORGANISM="Pseudo-nitzschia heimii, Strain UNC1101" /LENGTH=957 /DNA_ID=CAMNT_0042625475 /DNA_START=63 /DNA_END=2936 /DNA_ORIENTATION=+